jgi:hypothetical protein
MGNIRLACRFCDREDYDSVDVIPADWFDIEVVQTYEASQQSVELSDPNRSAFEWYTHLGVCPLCQEVELDASS